MSVFKALGKSRHGNNKVPSAKKRRALYRQGDATLSLALLCKDRQCKAGANGTDTCQLTSQHLESYMEVAGKGNLAEFERLYKADNSRLELQDGKGQAPIHKAAENGRNNIIQYICDKGGNLNCQDKHGNTALHLAVTAGQVASIELLVSRGADSTVFNDDQLPPLHLAVEVNNIPSLKALLSCDAIDPNLPGEKGLRALHLCAFKDRDECAKLLLESRAKPCLKCDNGFFPINIAGKCASAKTLEVLIKHVEKMGYKREDVLTFCDKENNMPLHCAVNSGDMKAVDVCLKAGAPVDAKQEDKSTPLHFACAQGSIQMVQLMYEMQPERFAVALATQDVLNMTPLHRAALFDHVTLVEFLLKQDADINAQDVHDRTPLLLASSKGGWRTVHSLLKQGADISLRDKENRNFLHLAIKYGCHIDKFGCAVLKGLKRLLNERDDFGCTPLHYASKEGHLLAIDDLLKLGATINPKDNEKKSPFHFAARYGRYNTCKRLMESDMGPNIINETDGDGLSALHIAAQNGHTKIITLLMQKGAYVTKDNMDNSPLHLAAENGYTRSMKLLLTVYPNLLDCANKNGDTALHVAAMAGHTSTVELLLCLGAKFLQNKEKKTFFDIAIQAKKTDVAFAIVRDERWEEAMELYSPMFGTPMNGLVQNLPDVCMAALDRCQVYTNDPKCKDFCIHYNFKYLQCPLRCRSYLRKKGETFQPMLALNTMVQFGRVQCLSHAVSVAFLNMKWRAYGSWFHITNLLVYVIFLGLLTFLVSSCTYQFSDVSANNVTNASSSDTVTVVPDKLSLAHRFSIYCVIIFCGLSMVKEIAQIFQQKGSYFVDLTNLLEWVLYVTAILYVVPFLTAEGTASWQWETGAIAIFLAWFNCLLYLQRFDFFGIYVVMFLEILRTLVQVLSVFSILIVAFGMAFFLLMQREENHAYASPGLSMLRSAMMMLELDYMASFNDPYTDSSEVTMFFGGTTIALLVLFVLLMPILLMNLLIGLAVGDIESVQANATLKRLAMQVQLHTDLEKKLPMKILEMVDKSEYKWFPNSSAGYIQKFWAKMTVNSGHEDMFDPALSHQSYLCDELRKQKERLKDLSTNMTKQYDLLRLIVQKMEIHTEDDNRDEGNSTDNMDLLGKGSRWSSHNVRHNLVRQSAVVTQWKNSMDKTL